MFNNKRIKLSCSIDFTSIRLSDASCFSHVKSLRETYLEYIFLKL